MAKQAIIGGLCGFGLAAVLGGCAYWLYPGDPVIATYRGGEIRHSELVNGMESEFGAEMLQEIITKRLISQAVSEHNLALSDVDLELWVDDYKQQPEVQEVLAAGQFDEAKLREHLRTTVPLYYLALLDTPETEREKYFETHRGNFEQMELSHILLGSESEARQLRERITGPDSFATMAIVHSLDERNRDFAGSLGRVTRAELEDSFGPEVAKALFKVPLNHISRPLQGVAGWHIFLVKSRTTDYQALKRRVIAEMAQPKLGACLETLRDSSEIKVLWKAPPVSQPSPSATASAVPAPQNAPATSAAAAPPSAPANGAASAPPSAPANGAASAPNQPHSP